MACKSQTIKNLILKSGVDFHRFCFQDFIEGAPEFIGDFGNDGTEEEFNDQKLLLNTMVSFL